MAEPQPQREFRGLAVRDRAEGIKVLGSFIGHRAWVRGQLLDAVAKMEEKYDAIAPLVDKSPQAALHAAQRCHVRRITHLLRTHQSHALCKNEKGVLVSQSHHSLSATRCCRMPVHVSRPLFVRVVAKSGKKRMVVAKRRVGP